MRPTKEQLQSWARRIHANATAHGWHEEEKPGYHWLGMVMTEVAEAIEADRKGRRFSEEAKEKYLAVTTDSEGYHVTVAIMKMAYEDFIKGTVEEGATIHGEVFLDEGSLIRSGVYIKGPVYIGKNCDIGPNSYIRGNSYFGDNVHIGNAVEIKNSIIMENTNVSHLSYVGDSILGSNCNIAAGTNIANLRFDNKNVKTTIKNKKTDTGRRKLGAIVGDFVKTGINSSLSPGVKIGVRSTIGSGVLLYEDLESDMRVLVRQEHIFQNKKETGQISLEEAEENKE